MPHGHVRWAVLQVTAVSETAPGSTTAAAGATTAAAGVAGQTATVQGSAGICAVRLSQPSCPSVIEWPLALQVRSL